MSKDVEEGTDVLATVPSQVLGRADARHRPVIEQTAGETVVRWLAPDGRAHLARRGKAGSWLPGATDIALTFEAAAGEPGALLDRIAHPAGELVLRSGRRRPGVRPAFPGAGLVISRVQAGGWTDIAFADDMPDAEVTAGALSAAGEELTAAYIVLEAPGQAVCRVLTWRPVQGTSRRLFGRALPDLPGTPGVAGAIAGRHRGVLLVAGGANFPERPPWEGGAKRMHDGIFFLAPGAPAWRRAGRLPAPRAYAAVVSTPRGVLVIGGEDNTGVCPDAYFLAWTDSGVVIEPAPAPPVPVTNGLAVLLDDTVYLAGGFDHGVPRLSTGEFAALHLGEMSKGWTTLPTWPGPPRAQGVMGVLNGKVYLASGLWVRPGGGSAPETDFLKDAYRYDPVHGWERLPDLPWSAVAAPSPAPVVASSSRLLVAGGVDGRQAGLLPRTTRVPEDVLCFDEAAGGWRLWPERWTEPVVNAPVVADGEGWVIVSGETMAACRTPQVQRWNAL